MKPKRLLVLSIFAAAVVGSLSAGCNVAKLGFLKTAPPAPPVAAASVYSPLPLDLSLGRPNEAGEVPILEYHELTPDGKKPHAYQYPLSKFRSDMQNLYKLGYRPINLSELVSGKIDCPAGKSPVVITFDDALRGQLDYTPAGQVSPDCAVGVLQQMHAKHSDWPLRATFFVLPRKDSTEYFYQTQFSQAKLQWLAKNGFELGNHTVHHLAGIRHWPDEKVEGEFAEAAKLIDDNVPGYNVHLLALPFGVFPKNRLLVQKGSYEGLTYSNDCALLAGASPAPSPITKQWNPYRLQRIIPGNGRFMIGYWLKYLQSHQQLRYVSDGDPNTMTVPSDLNADVDQANVKKLGLHLRVY